MDWRLKEDRFSRRPAQTETDKSRIMSSLVHENQQLNKEYFGGNKMILAFAHPGIVVPDLEEAIGFYSKMFGFKVIGNDKPACVIQLAKAGP